MSQTLTNFLTGIADAIRKKKGTTDSIAAQNFATEISNLSGSGENTLEITNASYLFYGGARVELVDTLIPYITNLISCHCMFYNCSTLYEINTFSQIDTSKVTDMGCMFYGCSRLHSLDLSNFDTSQVTTFNSLFNGCYNLCNIDFSNFSTSNVTTMNNMFCNCQSITKLNLTSFDTSNVKDMSYMFGSCTSLTTVDLSSFNMSNVRNVWKMFDYCYVLQNITFNSNYSFCDDSLTSQTIDLSTTALTADSYVAMIGSIGENSTGYERTFKLKSTLYSSLTDEQKALATDKNYTLTSS